jgi:hypothetical protein
MSEIEQSPEPGTKEAVEPPEGGGFFTRLEDRFVPHAEHAEADVSTWAADVSTALRDHAGTVFDVSGDLMSLVKLIDPADAPLFAAAEALVPKVYAMVQKATALAQGALKST